MSRSQLLPLAAISYPSCRTVGIHGDKELVELSNSRRLGTLILIFGLDLKVLSECSKSQDQLEIKK